ncbi:MAG: GIY-YIG nuclease family protein, partial [bacterium]
MLKKYDYTEVSTQQIAEHLNFSEEEQKMIKMFWEPTFNGSWIYLNDEIILGQLITDTGRSALTNFYKRVLLTEEYIENVDYKQINKDDELVKEYDQNDSSRKLNQKNKAKQGAKKYYAVTGETYKDLLQRSANKKGKTTRQYYRKIEQLAIMMKDYLVALNLYLMQKQIEAKDLTIKENYEFNNRLNSINIELLTFKKNNQKNESIYIVATSRYASQGIFKIGRTKSMKSRTSTHNNTHITGDKVKVIKEYKVGDCVAVEHYVHRALNGLLINGEKEFFLCPYDLLENIVDVIVNDNGNHSGLINSVIDTVNNLRISNTYNWTKG